MCTVGFLALPEMSTDKQKGCFVVVPSKTGSCLQEKALEPSLTLLPLRVTKGLPLVAPTCRPGWTCQRLHRRHCRRAVSLLQPFMPEKTVKTTFHWVRFFVGRSSAPANQLVQSFELI